MFLAEKSPEPLDDQRCPLRSLDDVRQRVEVDGLPRLGLDDAVDALAPLVVRDAEHRDTVRVTVWYPAAPDAK